jgi:enoyl-CoA hydratase/carnithine racemase
MIKVEHKDNVAIITLDRANRRNALGSAMVEDLERRFAELDRETSVGAIVLTGAQPSFCAGSDLKELGTMNLAEMAEHEAITAAIARKITFLNTPVIAAVEGHAFGGGFILACSCDLIVTSAAARWNLAEVPNGWLPPWGLQALVSRVGPVVAKRLTFGHELLSGADVFRLGLADYVIDEGQSLEEATRIASLIAGMPQPAVASTKQFFAPLVAGPSEALDASANRVFIDNCKHERAMATLARFGAKA